MSGLARTLLLVAVAILAGALAVQNQADVSLRFLVWESRVLPVWVFLLIALAIGIVIGGATLLLDYARIRRQLGKERRRADEAMQRAEAGERELSEARARSTAIEPALREDIEVLEEDDPGSTAISRPGRGGGFE